MKRIALAASLLALFAASSARAEDDPFAKGADALAVTDSDGSSSVRAKLKLSKMKPDMVQVQVKGINDKKFPHCILLGRVLKAATAKKKFFKLMARGKTYPFRPVYKMKRKKLVLKNKMNQNNLGACYYPKNTRLIIRVSGLTKDKKAFKASEIYLK